MSGDPLERELRQGREFSLAEAIGRLAGSGGLKGASPVARLRQAQAEVEDLVRRRLHDPGGALIRVLVREIGESRALLDRPDHPAEVVTAQVGEILAAEPRLRELVRMADMEWGRLLDERPHFDQEGQAPHPDDPYTTDSVRSALVGFLAALTAG